MRKISFLACLVLTLTLFDPQCSISQEIDALEVATMEPNKTYEVVTDNGVKLYRQVAATDVDPDSEMGRLVANMKMQTAIVDARSPLNRILNNFNPDNIALAVSEELTAEQKQQLADLSDQFQEQAKGKSGFDLINLKKEYYATLQNILLPEQLTSIRNFRVDEGVFKFICQPKVANHLGLKDSKIDEIEAKCRLANEAVADAIAKQQVLLDKMRSEMDDIMGSMSKDQREKLGKLLNKKIERYFDDFDLHSMLKTTDIQIDKL